MSQPAAERLLLRTVFAQGVFTTIGVCDHRPWFLEAHLSRLEGEYRRLGESGLPRARLAELVAAAVRNNGMRRGVVRLGAVRGQSGKGLFALCEPARSTPREVAIQLVAAASSPGDLPKSLHHLRWCSYRRQAEAAGCFDLLLVRAGQLTETSRCNLFVDLGDGLLTPPDAEVFAGIARRVLLANRELAIRRRPILLDDLKRARQVFLANSVRGPLAVSRVADPEGRTVWKGDGTLPTHLRATFRSAATA